MQVGIRELKAHLSDYIGRAAAGEAITVTDRGTPVAVIAPLLTSDLERGYEEGWAEPPKRTGLEPRQTRFNSSRAVAEVLDEDRG